MKIFLSMFVAMLATFIVHEGAHALAGAALGHAMEVSSNHASPVAGAAPKNHATLISAAGPAATALGALLVLSSGWRMLLAFQIVFAAFLMRLLATGISLLNPNDEMRISESLGWNPWALPVAVTGGLFLVTLIVAAGVRPSWKSVGLSAIGAVAAIALATAGEPLMPVLTIPALR
jgi:hypothetical protein